MPRTAKPGERINRYEIIQLLNSGAMAKSYAAKAPGKEKVFFKQYKSPTITVSWYKEYVGYQQELKRRIESSTAKSFTYRFIEFFEADFGCRTYFQVFEFVDGGHDLEAILERGRKSATSISWDQRVSLARVMMTGVNALHEAKIVHCDLKPPNIQLFKDPTITAGYRLKVIDMDFSILADRKAPWHGQEGYVGSPTYFSPEHLKGSVPEFASDVFTCGLILYELLGGAHPYRDENDYKEAALSYRAPKPKFLDKMPGGASDEQVASILHRCLAPAPRDRPSAKDVNLALNGKLLSDPAARPPATPSRRAPPPKRDAIPVAASDPQHLSQLQLSVPGGGALKFGVRTEVGKHLCKPLGDDAQFVAATQFVVERDADGNWILQPHLTATNQTMVNGKAVRAAIKLKDGDIIGIGNEAKGIVKLPLSVHIV